MNMTRRSFLKAAGLTVVAAAGASMFTGCSTILNPEITIFYEEVDSTGKTVTAPTITKGLTDWSKGKKSVTKTSSMTKVKDDTQDVTVEDALKELRTQLSSDGYKGDTSKLTIYVKDNAKKLSYTKKDSAHYEMTVKFYAAE